MKAKVVCFVLALLLSALCARAAGDEELDVQDAGEGNNGREAPPNDNSEAPEANHTKIETYYQLYAEANVPTAELWHNKIRLAAFKTALAEFYAEVKPGEDMATKIDKVAAKYFPKRVEQLWRGLHAKYPKSTAAKLAAAVKGCKPEADTGSHKCARQLKELGVEGTWVQKSFSADTAKATPYIPIAVAQATMKIWSQSAFEYGEMARWSAHTGKAAKPKDFHKAALGFHRALEQDPEHGLSARALAVMLTPSEFHPHPHRADLVDGIYWAKFALSQAPKDGEVRLALAKAFEHIGEQDVACKEFDSAWVHLSDVAALRKELADTTVEGEQKETLVATLAKKEENLKTCEQKIKACKKLLQDLHDEI